MKTRCTIKDVSEILGISTDSIRLYEKEGLVKPERDPHNGYRYYSAETIQKIMAIVLYRKLNASIKEIDQILKADNLDSLSVNCAKLIETNEKKIRELQISNDKLKFMQKHLCDLTQAIDKYDFRPLERIYVPAIKSSDTITNDSIPSKYFNDGTPLVEDLRASYFSYGNECYILHLNENHGITHTEHMYALWEPMMKVSPISNQIDTTPYLEEDLCVHTVVEIKNSNYRSDTFTNMVNLAISNGYKYKDYVYSFYIISLSNDEMPKNYFELYLPVYK